MHYEINVTKRGKHYFGTHERSLTTREQALELYWELMKRFPKFEDFEVTVYLVESHSRQVKF